ncbi:MAG: hypothetical protein NTZ08_01265 [Verrucomicrobia bacterium]|nr:hypothetical protein [Verrucomicrobiota bacterium]
MRPATARRILTCHVDDPNGDVPPVMQSALKALGKSPELQADYEKQSRIDANLRTLFKDAEVPDEALSGFASLVCLEGIRWIPHTGLPAWRKGRFRRHFGI